MTQFRFHPIECALIVVDVQVDFCSPTGSTAKRYGSREELVESSWRVVALRFTTHGTACKLNSLAVPSGGFRGGAPPIPQDF